MSDSISVAEIHKSDKWEPSSWVRFEVIETPEESSHGDESTDSMDWADDDDTEESSVDDE
jgi:hypothetical protein